MSEDNNMKNSVSRAKEWLNNFKNKLNADMPKIDKYVGKVTHVKTTF